MVTSTSPRPSALSAYHSRAVAAGPNRSTRSAVGAYPPLHRELYLHLSHDVSGTNIHRPLLLGRPYAYSVMRINVGILPCRSSSVWIFTAALCWRNLAQGNSERQRSMVVESKAYRLWSNSTPIGSLA